jgi:hypothetical protein
MHTHVHKVDESSKISLGIWAGSSITPAVKIAKISSIDNSTCLLSSVKTMESLFSPNIEVPSYSVEIGGTPAFQNAPVELISKVFLRSSMETANPKSMEIDRRAVHLSCAIPY